MATARRAAMSAADETEASPEPTPAAEPPPEITTFVTTTMTKDYMARLLVNATPGTSNATDYIGRSVVAGDLDYMGRALVA